MTDATDFKKGLILQCYVDVRTRNWLTKISMERGGNGDLIEVEQLAENIIDEAVLAYAKNGGWLDVQP